MNEVMDVKDVAEDLRCTEGTVHKYAATRRIPMAYISTTGGRGVYRITRSFFNAWLEQRMRANWQFSHTFKEAA